MVNSLKELENEIKQNYHFERSPIELNTWVDRIFNNIRHLKETLKLSYVEFGNSREIKKIREEVLLFAYSNLSEYGVEIIKLNHGNENYDAELLILGNWIKAECACAKDGHLESYQFRSLDEFGSAPATGITVGNLKQSILSKEILYSECVSSADEIELNLKLLNQTIERKCNMNYNPSYWLFIGTHFHDFENFPFDKIDIMECRQKFDKLIFVDYSTKSCKLVF